MTADETPLGIPSLPRLGTTWYARGPRYWLRRVWSAFGLLVVAALMAPRRASPPCAPASHVPRDCP